jgi:hypothetical protein
MLFGVGQLNHPDFASTSLQKPYSCRVTFASKGFHSSYLSLTLVGSHPPATSSTCLLSTTSRPSTLLTPTLCSWVHQLASTSDKNNTMATLQETTDHFRREIELSSIQHLVLFTSNHSRDRNATHTTIRGYNLARFRRFTCHLESDPIRDTVWIYQVNHGSQWSETIACSDLGARVYTQMLAEEAEQVLSGLELSPVAPAILELLLSTSHLMHDILQHPPCLSI